jgi:hypothetical protein
MFRTDLGASCPADLLSRESRSRRKTSRLLGNSRNESAEEALTAFAWP